MKTLILATLYTCLSHGIDTECQYKEVQADRNFCKSGVVEMKLPKGSSYDKFKVVTLCKG